MVFWGLSRQPGQGVDVAGGGAASLAQLEMERTAAATVAGHGTEGLAGLDGLAVAYGYAGEVAVDGIIATVAHDDHVGAAHIGHCAHFAVVDAAGLGA